MVAIEALRFIKIELFGKVCQHRLISHNLLEMKAQSPAKETPGLIRKIPEFLPRCFTASLHVWVYRMQN
ncbi:hypothetical protein [Rhizobium etli]|uniref:Uncharacterized protein n=1 Tax=Rhizobium etli TaxID=29449 RepID=A0A7W6VB13_RHIET|nr:hypothetical protein [Rhizobium etli]MBB4480930.1 hypothetical protein [Rhizobium etli]MBB4536820.1 hypothetical protein [Rhizobium etli]